MGHFWSSLKSPRFFLSVLVFAVLLLSLIGVSSQNASLKVKVKDLSDESQKLADSLKSLENENKELTEKLEAIEKDKSGFHLSLESLKNENESLQIEIKKVQEQLSSVTEEKTALEEMLIHKNKEIEKMKKDLPAPAAPAPAVSPVPPVSAGAADTDARLKEKDEEIERLSQQNKILSQRLDRLHKTVNDKITEITVAKIALEETVAQARKRIEEEWGTVDLGTIRSSPGTAPAGTQTPKEPLEETRKIPKKDGRVLAVNQEHGFVVINLGKADNVKPDGVYVVKKDGEEVATLNTLEVRDAMTACNVQELKSGRKISVDDLVLPKKI
ncbi:MAG: hypothetical protein HYZ52_04130 [Candidatus Omnitrophica bacterium]|nr:hypothetical protein [Candidatus Omnitrophota bacterium]